MGAENGDLFNPELLKELGASNLFFDNLVDMIPAKLYVVGNTGDEAYNPKYRKGQHKESKEARRARNKQAKLARYDPSQAETTTQAKKRSDKEKYELSDDEDDDDDDEHFVPPDGEEDDDGENDGDGHEDGNTGNDDGAEETEEETPKTPASNEEELEINTEGLSRIEILRAKLHAKIAQKQAQNKRHPTNTIPPNDVRNNAKHYKSQTISKRAARKAERQRLKQLAIAKKMANGGSAVVAGGKKGFVDKQIHVEMPNKPKKTVVKPPETKTLKEDLAGINFGSIAGLNVTEYYKDNKSLKPRKKKDLDKLLQEAQDKQKRLQELKAGDEQDKAEAKRMLWGETLKEASGSRSKNDPTKIKKAMKRKANKKAKSAIAWKARVEKTQDSIKERQSIRTHNLGQRKKGGSAGANLSKKRINTEDGGDGSGTGDSKRRRMGPHADKSRAGFEGKKQGFINTKETKGSSSVSAK